MICDVVLPVGPGHEQIYRRAVESVRIATRNKGSFDRVGLQIVDDTEGKNGRSKSRNTAIKNSKADWLFFLDADDIMHPNAFKTHSDYPYVDALFGNIYETNQGVAVWRYQIPTIDCYEDILNFDPYHTLQMGHFVKREVAASILFDEEMNCGEDVKYYLSLWKNYNCKKVEECLFLNDKSNHSQGPRSATGREWTEVVTGLLEEARIEKEPFQFKEGYWFPSTDKHFTKGTFELYQIDECLDACKKKRIAIDVGAHVGSWSRELAKYFETVISFEAKDINFRCLEKNTEFATNVERHYNAVGDETKKISIHPGDPGNTGNGYVVEGGDVEMIRLDDCINGPVDFIKMDVEGYEPMALEGARRIIDEYHPAILIEQTPQLSGRYGYDHLAAGRLLELWGYHLVKQMNKNYLYAY